MVPYSPASPWRLDPAVVQLNHGSFGACPVPVLEAQTAWRERMESDLTRFLDRELPGLLEAPDAMLGAMAALPLRGLASDAEAEAMRAALAMEDGIEVALGGWPVRAAREHPEDPPRCVVLRISAQRYNTPDDVDRLADALRRRLPLS